MTPFWPRLDANGLPTWIRADLRALPESWSKTDLRTRRPMIPASADVGAVSRTTAPTHGRVPACSPRAGFGTRRVRRHDVSRLIAVVALAVCCVLLVPVIVGDGR